MPINAVISRTPANSSRMDVVGTQMSVQIMAMSFNIPYINAPLHILTIYLHMENHATKLILNFFQIFPILDFLFLRCPFFRMRPAKLAGHASCRRERLSSSRVDITMKATMETRGYAVRSQGEFFSSVGIRRELRHHIWKGIWNSFVDSVLRRHKWHAVSMSTSSLFHLLYDSLAKSVSVLNALSKNSRCESHLECEPVRRQKGCFTQRSSDAPKTKKSLGCKESIPPIVSFFKNLFLLFHTYKN